MKHSNRYIGQMSLLVDDYDKAIEFYTKTLEFELLEDTGLSPEKRWVRVAPKGASDFCLLLAKASNETQKQYVGNQTGGRVFLFLYTDDFWRDYNALLEKNVKFARLPNEEEYGTVAVFEDLYGNLWDLIGPNVK